MSDHVLFLSEACAAKRRLAQLFQSEGLGQASHAWTPIAIRDSIRPIRTDIEQNSKPFRETCREHGLFRSRTPITLRARQPGQMKRDRTASAFVFTLVLVGVTLAAYTDRPIFWLLIGPAPVAVLHAIRMFLRRQLTRQEDLLEVYERDR
jgi:hypothetical protein